MTQGYNRDLGLVPRTLQAAGVGLVAGGIGGAAKYSWQFTPASTKQFSSLAMLKSAGAKGGVVATALVVYTGTESMLDIILETQTVGASAVAGVATGVVAGMARQSLAFGSLAAVVFAVSASVVAIAGEDIHRHREVPYPGYKRPF